MLRPKHLQIVRLPTMAHKKDGAHEYIPVAHVIWCATPMRLRVAHRYKSWAMGKCGPAG
jgi:hypothetical protein